jgi:hypothetical protein
MNFLYLLFPLPDMMMKKRNWLMHQNVNDFILFSFVWAQQYFMSGKKKLLFHFFFSFKLS